MRLLFFVAVFVLLSVQAAAHVDSSLTAWNHLKYHCEKKDIPDPFLAKCQTDGMPTDFSLQYDKEGRHFFSMPTSFSYYLEDLPGGELIYLQGDTWALNAITQPIKLCFYSNNCNRHFILKGAIKRDPVDNVLKLLPGAIAGWDKTGINVTVYGTDWVPFYAHETTDKGVHIMLKGADFIAGGTGTGGLLQATTAKGTYTVDAKITAGTVSARNGADGNPTVTVAGVSGTVDIISGNKRVMITDSEIKACGPAALACPANPANEMKMTIILDGKTYYMWKGCTLSTDASACVPPGGTPPPSPPPKPPEPKEPEEPDDNETNCTDECETIGEKECELKDDDWRVMECALVGDCREWTVDEECDGCCGGNRCEECGESRCNGTTYVETYCDSGGEGCLTKEHPNDERCGGNTPALQLKVLDSDGLPATQELKRQGYMLKYNLSDNKTIKSILDFYVRAGGEDMGYSEGDLQSQDNGINYFAYLDLFGLDPGKSFDIEIFCQVYTHNDKTVSHLEKRKVNYFGYLEEPVVVVK